MKETKAEANTNRENTVKTHTAGIASKPRNTQTQQRKTHTSYQANKSAKQPANHKPGKDKPPTGNKSKPQQDTQTATENPQKPQTNQQTKER